MKLNELTASSGIVIALEAVLKNGFQSSFYKDYIEYIQSWHGEELAEDEEFILETFSGAWEALDFVSTEIWHEAVDGLKARVCQSATRADYGDHDEYYAVLALTDGANIRYFQRMGWYSSYNGGELVDGETREVYPEQVTVTEWRNVQ